MTALITMIIKCCRQFCQLFCYLIICYLTADLAISQSSDEAANDRLGRDLTYWEELAFWQAIKNSEELADLQAYLQQYPQGRYAALAQIKLKLLQARQSISTTQKETESLTSKSQTNNDNVEPSNSDGSLEFKPTLTRPIQYIALKSSNVRAAPTTVASKLGKLEKGQRVQVTGSVANTRWLRIRTEDGRMGYVFSELLQPVAQQ